jgi:hypothetical protein
MKLILDSYVHVSRRSAQPNKKLHTYPTQTSTRDNWDVDDKEHKGRQATELVPKRRKNKGKKQIATEINGLRNY